MNQCCVTQAHLMQVINLVKKADVCLSPWENCSMSFCHGAAAQRAFCRPQTRQLVKPLSLGAFVLEQL